MMATMDLDGHINLVLDESENPYDGSLVFAVPLANKAQPLYSPHTDAEAVRSLSYEHDPIRGTATRWRYTGMGVLAPDRGRDALELVTRTVALHALDKYERGQRKLLQSSRH